MRAIRLESVVFSEKSIITARHPRPATMLPTSHTQRSKDVVREVGSMVAGRGKEVMEEEKKVVVGGVVSGGDGFGWK